MGLCAICGKPGKMFTCAMCGRNFCMEHFDVPHGICINCKPKINK
ncbi:orotate phosphoribosyltransferase [Thermoplasmatales archaeon ex4484_30]|nr:MAG: orotate phosphoribosyltransferase [Thermoplasmatales archaeon ex4484_30]